MRADTCPTCHEFYRIRRTLMQALDVDRHDIRPSDRLEDIIPSGRRRALWRQLRKEGFRLGPLSLPPKVQRIVLAIHAIKVIAAPWGIGMVGLLLLVPLSVLMWLATRPWATHIQHGPTTLRDVVIRSIPIEAIRAYCRSIRSEHWQRQMVSMKVRLIVAEWAGLPLEAVQPETRFADLGL